MVATSLAAMRPHAQMVNASASGCSSSRFSVVSVRSALVSSCVPVSLGPRSAACEPVAARRVPDSRSARAVGTVPNEPVAAATRKPDVGVGPRALSARGKAPEG